MSPSVKFITLSATLLALGLTGCNDTEENNTTTTEYSDNNAVGSLFDDTPAALATNVWKVPRFGLFYHSEQNTESYALQATATASARPGAELEDLTADRAVAVTRLGDVMYQPAAIQNGSGDNNFKVITQSVTSMLGGIITGERFLARGRDNMVYVQNAAEWNLFMPDTTTAGTAWQNTYDMTANGVGNVFVYRSIGTIAYRPTLRVKDGPLAADPNLDRSYIVVDADGGSAASTDRAAIDYLSGEGFQGSLVPVRRVGRYVVANSSVTSPNGVAGCVQVTLTLDYRLQNNVAVEDSSVIGLSSYSGSYTLYWKADAGWVYWTGSESAPDFSFNNINSSRNSESALVLSTYNENYDAAFFGVDDVNDTTTPTYKTGWDVGFGYGYKDASLAPANAANNRKTLADALYDYLNDAAVRLTDADLALDANDNGTKKGKREAIEAGFIAGYNMGVDYYGQDFTPVVTDVDTLIVAVPVRTDRTGTIQIAYNKVPDAYRWDANILVTGGGAYPYYLENSAVSATGRSYTNGYDGAGHDVVTVYDNTVTVDPSKIKPKKDAYNQDMSGANGAFIKLPTIGRIVTTAVTGSMTDTKISVTTVN